MQIISPEQGLGYLGPNNNYISYDQQEAKSLYIV